jgi:hypothetical protein
VTKLNIRLGTIDATAIELSKISWYSVWNLVSL